jgi:hypothetical protein
VAAVTGLAVTGCGATAPGPAASGSRSPTASASATPSTKTDSASGPLAPLTGLPAGGAAAAKRAAVAVDVAGPAASGLASADVVFEQPGSPARYVAVFQSRQATVAPVTGTEPSDGQLLSVLHPLIAYSGAAAPAFITALGRAKVITDVGYSGHPSAYTTGAQGLSTSAGAIAAAVRPDTAPPVMFRFRGASTGASTLADAGVSRPGSVRVTTPGGASENWVFSARHDRWQLVSGGPAVQVANLVVQTVPYKGIGLHHSVQSAQVIGTGRVQVFSGSVSGGSGGTAASGTWAKPHIGELTNYFGTSGSPMAFQPGPTWIILAPQGTQVSTSGG